MDQMQFERVDAVSFALFDTTGSKVGSARDRAELFSLLDETRDTDPTRLGSLRVVAVDGEGQPIASWPALSLLEVA